MSINKKELTERDICTKFIASALVAAKWDLMNQIREKVSFTKGRFFVRCQLSTRGDALGRRTGSAAHRRARFRRAPAGCRAAPNP